MAFNVPLRMRALSGVLLLARAMMSASDKAPRDLYNVTSRDQRPGDTTE